MQLNTRGENTGHLNVYSRLDQRLVRHGKPLYQVIKAFAEETDPAPSNPIELLARVNEVFGAWSADAAHRIQPQTILAVEHLALMDEIACEQGVDVATVTEVRLQQVVANQFSRYMGLDLKAPDQNRLIPLPAVKSVNAYTALAQRTALIGFQPHEAIRDWVLAKREHFMRLAQPTSEVGYLRLAKQMAGPWPATPETDDKLQRVMSELLDGISKVNSPGQAVVVQSALESAFARTIRKVVKEFGFERHLNALSPSM